MKAFPLSAAELREAFGGISRQTLSEYVKAGMPKLKRGRYDLQECWKWRWEHFKPEEGGGTLSDERKRLVITQRQLKELQLKRENAAVVEVAAVFSLIDRLVGATKEKLLGLPTRIAVQVLACAGPTQARDLLDLEIRQVLTELSRGFDVGLAKHSGNGHEKRGTS